jgi:hypothetical protein
VYEKIPGAGTKMPISSATAWVQDESAFWEHRSVQVTESVRLLISNSQVLLHHGFLELQSVASGMTAIIVVEIDIHMAELFRPRQELSRPSPQGLCGIASLVLGARRTHLV